MLLPGGIQIVFELDGQQHYSQNGKAVPALYAEMVKDDRALRLKGYEVYRFGGYEFLDETNAKQMICEFLINYLNDTKLIYKARRQCAWNY